jgi:hypothetical protein
VIFCCFVVGALIEGAGATAVAQTFTQGDLYLASTVLPTVGNGVLKIDPTTGADTLLADLPDVNPFRGSLSWDPYRDRLLLNTSPNLGDSGLITIDALGNVAQLIPSLSTPDVIAARGDGIIYIWYAPTQRLRYIDATDQVHDVLDVAGTSPYTLSAAPIEMIYDPGTNALFLFQAAVQFTICTTTTAFCAIKVPLTADGTQVAGAETFVQQDVSTNSEDPVGTGYLPGGDLLVVVDTNNNTLEPRMLALDPAAMSLSVYASNGPYTGAAATNAGTFSSVRDEAVIFDILNGVLRAFGLGDSGAGTILATGLSGGTVSSLVEIHTTSAPPVPVLSPAVGALLSVLLGALGMRGLRDRRGGARRGLKELRSL